MPKRGSRLKLFGQDFQARQAARGRLPVWLGLLMPLMASSAMCSLTSLSVFVLWRLHKALHPEIPFSPMPVAALVIFFASFFGVMAPALMLLNLILAHIPPL